MNILEENRAFQCMKRDAIQMLEGKNPEEIAKNAGVVYSNTEKLFLIESLGKMYTLSYPDYNCREDIFTWHYLVMLHCLNLADGTPVSGELLTLGQMPGGLVRGTKFDQTMTSALEDFVKKHSEEEISQFFEKLGAEILEGKADLSVRLWYLPKVPLTVNIWFPDEEFPPSAKLLVDKSIEHYLTIEDAVTMGECILQMLREEA